MAGQSTSLVADGKDEEFAGEALPNVKQWRPTCDDTEADEVVFAARKTLARRIFAHLLSSAKFWIPSFVFALSNKTSSIPTGSPRHSSALDGIRGFACLAVMNYHILYVYQSFLYYGYGLAEDDLHICGRPQDRYLKNRWIHQLPIFRLVYSGTASVSVFFIIAGFVISQRPLKMAHRYDHAAALGAIGSSTLRRGIRLFLPPMVATFVTTIAVSLGLFEPGRILARDHDFITGIPEHHPDHLGSLSAQVMHWLYDVSHMMGGYSWKEYFPRYDVHLWTIGGEFRASMMVFLALPVYTLLKQPHRLVLQVGLIFYTYCWDRWEVVLFLLGMLLSDTHLLSKGRPELDHKDRLLSPQRPTKDRRIHTIAIEGLQLLILITSLYLLSAPDLCVAQTPGFETLGRLIPSFDRQPFRFYPMIGGFMLVFLVTQSSESWFLKRFILNSAVAQYLGKISYSVYLVHGPLNHWLGYRISHWMMQLIGHHTIMRYCLSFAISYLLLLIIVVWVADVFCRAVDMQCVKFAAWLQSQLVERK